MVLKSLRCAVVLMCFAALTSCGVAKTAVKVPVKATKVAAKTVF